MPWDKEAKVPIIEYWGTRHDFTLGLSIRNDGEEGKSCCGYEYSSNSGGIDPLRYNRYLSPFDGTTYSGI